MSPVATQSSLKSNAPSPSSVPHQYGTRIRSNSVIRPSARLRQSPDPPAPRKIRPAPTAKVKATAIASESPRVELPPFPPPHIMLHSDDMNSRVFLSIGRALMSVVRILLRPLCHYQTDGTCRSFVLLQDNRAMTIKDLADLSMKYGLSCQK